MSLQLPRGPNRISNALKSAVILRNGWPCRMNKAVETDGARWSARVPFWAACVPSSPYRRCGSCASSLRAPSHPTPVFVGTARTGPLLPSLVVKPESFNATRSTLHKLHRLIDRTRECFSACTLGRRTRGRSALDKIGIPWPILQSSWVRVAQDDWLGMS
jgi:hypothetical protein